MHRKTAVRVFQQRDGFLFFVLLFLIEKHMQDPMAKNWSKIPGIEAKESDKLIALIPSSLKAYLADT